MSHKHYDAGDWAQLEAEYQMNPQGFTHSFHDLLQDRNIENVPRITAMILTVRSDLEQLNASWKPVTKEGPAFSWKSRPPKHASHQGRSVGDAWRTLAGLMGHCEADDALVIFDALARSIEGHPRRAMPLMSSALNQPDIRVDLVRRYPEIFRCGQAAHDPRKPAKRLADTAEKSNAYLELARKNSGKLGWHDYENVRELLNALRFAGVNENVRIGWDEFTLLSVAAANSLPSVVKAFAEHLPEQLNLASNLGHCPLHSAVSSRKVENVRTLLECGADPRKAISKTNINVLELSVRKTPADADLNSCTGVLLQKVDWNADELRAAAEFATSKETRELVSAFLAQKIIKESIHQDRGLSPLAS